MAWSKEEDDFLRRYPDEHIKVLAEALDRKPKDVSKRRCKLGIKQKVDNVEDGFKRCYKCDTIKPLTDFYKNSTTYDGYQSLCKECSRIDKIEKKKLKKLEELKKEKLEKLNKGKEIIKEKQKKTYICSHCKKKLKGTEFYYLKNGTRISYCKECSKIINDEKKILYYKNKNYCK